MILDWFKTKRLLIKEKNKAIQKLSNGNANYVISKILNRNISWYNYKELDKQQQIEYYEDAQKILQSTVFINEFNNYIADLIQHIAKASKNHNHTIALRFSINGVEALKERLEKIVDPRKKESSKDNIYNVI